MGTFLLDTQILLWLANDPDKVSERSYEVILNNSNKLLCSYASIWELSIKLSIKKFTLDFPLEEFIANEIKRHSLKLLQVSLSSIYYSQSLPLVHKDPFDRIIASQSIVEKIPLISSDKIFDDYNIQRIW